MSHRPLLSLALLVFPLATLSANEPPRAPQGPEAITVKDGVIEFRDSGELVTRYHVGPQVAKPYFYPLLAPGGIPVTRGWPMEKGLPGETTDHVHQKSAWFCHGDVIPEGLTLKQRIKGVDGVDFWSEAPGHGRIVCTSIGTPRAAGKRFAVETKNEWRTADGQKILEETRTVTLHLLGVARLLILDIDLHASTVPITFGDTKEGSMGVRVNDLMAEKLGKGKLENAEGKVAEKAVWGYVSRWCDYSGPIQGKTVGIAIFDDPNNGPHAAWHSRSYGLMAANPFGRGRSGFPSQKGKTDLVKMNKGDHLKLRYGILVHEGDAAVGKVETHYQTFVKDR